MITIAAVNETLFIIRAHNPHTHIKVMIMANGCQSEIKFNEEDRIEIKRILPVGFAHGDRYSNEQIVGIERYC